MTDFTIAEDFPRSEIEFDARFSNPDACYQYLFQLKWPDGFVCKKCRHDQYWLSSINLYICTRCECHHSLTGETIMDSSQKPITYRQKVHAYRSTGIKDAPDILARYSLGFGPSI